MGQPEPTPVDEGAAQGLSERLMDNPKLTESQMRDYLDLISGDHFVQTVDGFVRTVDGVESLICGGCGDNWPCNGQKFFDTVDTLVECYWPVGWEEDGEPSTNLVEPYAGYPEKTDEERIIDGDLSERMD